MKRIIVAGGTGLIGSQLINRLKEKYNKITVLTRTPKKYVSSENINYTFWDGKSLIDDILNNAYAIINLTGENIGRKKWTEGQKNKILYSRLDASRAIFKSISLCSEKPTVWIQASATGYYGNSDERKFYEQSPKGEDSFLSDVCELWEKPVHDFIADIDIDKLRTVIVRTGVVLAKNSDFWKQVLLPFKFGVGVILANGKQSVPWIHIEDEINAILFLLENDSCQGIYNLSAPESARFSEIIDAIKFQKKTLFTLHLPECLLNLVFGKEKTEELILVNQDVSPQRLLEQGYHFSYHTIQPAVSSLLEK